ncbi:MAG: hypothetical protein JXQ71_13985 [Verrucomicrobia bacterium]|nr:hypothetical protein [Verrucomicrobiota bacterium]
MPEGAHVTSVEAIDAFRASLLVYTTKARPVLEEACDEVSRTRQWLESDRRIHWEHQVRRRLRDLEQAQQTLFSAGLSNLREATAAEKAAVQRARRALADAEAKLKLVKRWHLEFDHRVEPLLKQLEHLRTVLAHLMPKAAAFLALTLKSLDAYTGVPTPAADPPPPPASEEPDAAPDTAGAGAAPPARAPDPSPDGGGP